MIIRSGKKCEYFLRKNINNIDRYEPTFKKIKISQSKQIKLKKINQEKKQQQQFQKMKLRKNNKKQNNLLQKLQNKKTLKLRKNSKIQQKIKQQSKKKDCIQTRKMKLTKKQVCEEKIPKKRGRKPKIQNQQIIKQKVIKKKIQKNKFKKIIKKTVQKIVEQKKNIEKQLEIFFSFDTTCSMSLYVEELQQNIQSLIEKLFKDFKLIKLGIVAHSDYEYSNPCEILPLTTDKNQIIQFIEKINKAQTQTPQNTLIENYEFVLNQVLQQKWSDFSNKVLVLIGDQLPHDKMECEQLMIRYKIEHPRQIDWRDQVSKFKDKQIKIYGVQIGDKIMNYEGNQNYQVSEFYQYISKETNGVKLNLNDCKQIQDLIYTLCYREAFQNLSRLIQDMKNENKLKGDIKEVIYQIVQSNQDEFIQGKCVKTQKFKYIVKDHGYIYVKGHGYCQMKRKKQIEGPHKIILQDKQTNKIWERENLNQLCGMDIDLKNYDEIQKKFNIFVQSIDLQKNINQGDLYLIKK